jgi:hypothetical protein
MAHHSCIACTLQKALDVFSRSKGYNLEIRNIKELGYIYKIKGRKAIYDFYSRKKRIKHPLILVDHPSIEI